MILLIIILIGGYFVYTNYKDIDGGWSEWSEWSECDKECDTGIQVRIRQCNNPSPQAGGKQCEGTDTEQRYCNTHQCVLDGGWSSWTNWSKCSKDCGGGKSSRFRVCNNPIPQAGGKDCVGNDTEEKDCNIQACPQMKPGTYKLKMGDKYCYVGDNRGVICDSLTDPGSFNSIFKVIQPDSNKKEFEIEIPHLLGNTKYCYNSGGGVMACVFEDEIPEPDLNGGDPTPFRNKWYMELDQDDGSYTLIAADSGWEYDKVVPRYCKENINNNIYCYSEYPTGRKFYFEE